MHPDDKDDKVIQQLAWKTWEWKHLVFDLHLYAQI